jgi:hypothetical protein
MSTPVLPADLEAHALRRGPATLRELVRLVRGTSAAARCSGLARNTLDRWMEPPWSPETALLDRSVHVSWGGYPAPFSVLDQVTKSAPGLECGFIVALSKVQEHPLRALRARPFGLLSLKHLDRSAWIRAARAIGVPNTTAYRLLQGNTYPEALSGLDRIANKAGYEGWLEALIELDLSRVSRRVRPRALEALLLELDIPGRMRQES